MSEIIDKENTKEQRKKSSGRIINNLPQLVASQNKQQQKVNTIFIVTFFSHV